MRPTDNEIREIAACVDAMGPVMVREAKRLGISVGDYQRLVVSGLLPEVRPEVAALSSGSPAERR